MVTIIITIVTIKPMVIILRQRYPGPMGDTAVHWQKKASDKSDICWKRACVCHFR